METSTWVNIGSDSGLLPDVTKPLPEPTLTYVLWGIQPRAISSDMLMHLINKMSSAIAF